MVPVRGFGYNFGEWDRKRRMFIGFKSVGNIAWTLLGCESQLVVLHCLDRAIYQWLIIYIYVGGSRE